MKNWLNKNGKFLFLGAVFFPLIPEIVTAQPIQLIPHKEQKSEASLSDSTPQIMNGFWDGTPPSLFSTYYPKISIKLTSPTLQRIRTDILNEKYAPLSQDEAYERSLFNLLFKTGQMEKAQDFLANTFFSDKDELWMALKWAQGDYKAACDKIGNLLRSSPTLELKTQQVYCLFLRGEIERGKVASELLNESSPNVSPLINGLFDSSASFTFDDTIAKSPFLLNVWCSLGQEISEQDLETLPPALLRFIAKSEKAPQHTRLLAAQIALDEGSFTSDEFVSVLKEASQDSLFAKLALALKESNIKNLLPLFEKESQKKQLGLMAKAFKPLLSQLNPSQETLPLAPYLIRALLSVDEMNPAQKWGTFYMREKPEEAVALLPLLHIAFPEILWGEAQMKVWQAYQIRVNPQEAAHNSYSLRKILEALGEETGPALRGEASSPSWRQEKALLGETDPALLNAAANSNRKGEVYLLILASLGETPFKNIAVDKISHLIKALNKLGETEKARSLALEFLLAKDF